jgi:hypothetical protein
MFSICSSFFSVVSASFYLPLSLALFAASIAWVLLLNSFCLAICYLISLIFDGFISNLSMIYSMSTLSAPQTLVYVSLKTSLNSMFYPLSHSIRQIWHLLIMPSSSFRLILAIVPFCSILPASSYKKPLMESLLPGFKF